MSGLGETAGPRILEITRFGLFHGAMPDRTEWFCTGLYDGQPEGASAGLLDLWSKVRAGRFDLIVCEPGFRAPWGLDALARALFNRRTLSRRPAMSRLYAGHLARLAGGVPLVALDMEDHATIAAADFGLLRRGLLYFKRELPPDHYRLFTATGARGLPSRRWRESAALRGHLHKLRPVSFGAADSALAAFDPSAAKTADLFFAGETRGFPVRQGALEEVEALRREGYRIDIASGRLNRAEFYRRMAAAWLTLSPEGFGWDCFRHYEAAAMRSVPLMNYPSILRHAPLRDSEHCLFFGPEPGALATVVRAALADRERLHRMAESAAAHVASHHTAAAICAYILASAAAEQARLARE